ncbi:hypothetical protein J6590_056713 [Homalodisca vitripennis]|nr:hypothetical protein J6590_056713 [Homalodisca vitripennis]
MCLARAELVEFLLQVLIQRVSSGCDVRRRGGRGYDDLLIPDSPHVCSCTPTTAPSLPPSYSSWHNAPSCLHCLATIKWREKNNATVVCYDKRPPDQLTEAAICLSAVL